MSTSLFMNYYIPLQEHYCEDHALLICSNISSVSSLKIILFQLIMCRYYDAWSVHRSYSLSSYSSLPNNQSLVLHNALPLNSKPPFVSTVKDLLPGVLIVSYIYLYVWACMLHIVLGQKLQWGDCIFEITFLFYVLAYFSSLIHFKQSH